MKEASPVLADQKTAWEQLKTAISNATAEAGRYAFPMIEPVIKAAGSFIDTTATTEKAAREIQDAFSKAAGEPVVFRGNFKFDEEALETLRQQWLNLRDAFNSGEISKPEFENGVLRLRAALAVTNPYVDDYSTSLEEAARMEEIFQTLSGNVGDSLDGVGSAAGEAGQGASEMGLAAAMSAAAMGDVSTAATIAAAAIGNTGVAFAILGAAMRALPSAAGAMAAVEGALNQASSAATRLAGDVGGDRAVAIYEERKAAIEAYGATLVGLPVDIAAIRMAAFTQKFDDQDAAMRKASTGVSAYNKSLSELESTVTGLINTSVSSTKGLVDLTKPAGGVGGYDPNGPAANFGRMWDVAINGFKSQWLAPLQQMGLIPDSVIAAGEDALKEFAKRASTDFQKGTDFTLLDKGAIEAQVREKLAAKAAMDKLVADVMADLGRQGVKGPGVKAAVQGAVGAAAGAPTLGTEGETSAQSFQAGFVGGMNGIGAAIVATLGAEMKKTTTELQQAGATTGGVWAGGFMVSVNALPGSVYATLAAMVAPDVARILGQQGQRSGKPPE